MSRKQGSEPGERQGPTPQARAMPSEGPARLAVCETPGKPRSAAATMAAWPASVWIRMYAAIT